MNIIKRIINWFKRLFQKLFGKRKVKKVVINNSSLNNKKNKSFQKKNDGFDEEFPSYLLIDNNDKDKLLYSLAIMKNFLQENNDKLRAQEEKELINLIESKNPGSNKVMNQEDFLSLKQVESLINKLDTEDKKEVLDKYKAIVRKDDDFKIHLNEIEKTVDLIKKNDISIMTEDAIYKEISFIENDKTLMDNACVKIDNFNKLVSSYINDIDKDFFNSVVKEYNKVNYVTIASTIIDNKYESFKKLEDDFKHHRYNKFYYEREINQIKQELNKIKNLKNKKEVSEHIQNLKKELYTKSKDKYDLLYNNEIFLNFEKECDNLLGKINAKVVDIKKEEPKEKKEEDIKNKYLENILLRYKDIELARKLILMAQIEDEKLVNKDSIAFYVNQMYERFNEGLGINFNFNRNKTKTELVILYNDINKITSKLNKEPYIMVEHINFKMDDLTEAVNVKNEELSRLMKLNGITINEENSVQEKIDLLQDMNNPKKNDKRVLKKTNGKKG